jgi:hypothetical protein
LELPVGGETEEDMTFGEIYGHGKQIAILKSAMAKDRIAHAYLFYGMEGIGKEPWLPSSPGP